MDNPRNAGIVLPELFGLFFMWIDVLPDDVKNELLKDDVILNNWFNDLELHKHYNDKSKQYARSINVSLLDNDDWLVASNKYIQQIKTDVGLDY
jgi:hypothetical protein